MKPKLAVVPSPQDVTRAFEELGDIVTAKFMPGRTIRTSETPIAHGLRRMPIAWFPVNTGSVRPVQTSASDEQYIYASASTAGAYDLVVF